MKRNLLYLIAVVSVFAGCASNSRTNSYQEKTIQEYRHPLESEFRPGFLPYQEIYKKEHSIDKEEIKKRRSPFKRKLKADFT